MLGDVPEGHVAVYACDQDVSAHLGELSVTSLKARGVAGCVLDGGCRDIGFILDEGFPVFTPLRHARGLDLALGARGDAGAGHDRPRADRAGRLGRRRRRRGRRRPAAIAEDVLAEAEQKAATESEIRAPCATACLRSRRTSVTGPSERYSSPWRAAADSRPGDESLFALSVRCSTVAAAELDGEDRAVLLVGDLRPVR